jgi:hypothetical protein
MKFRQVNLADRRPEALQYLGASFGVTAPLLGFWQRAGYLPVYLRQTPSEVSCALIRAESQSLAWRLLRVEGVMSLLPAEVCALKAAPGPLLHV